MNDLIKEGKLKYYKPEGKQRGEWILTVEAMNILFSKKTKKMNVLYNKVIGEDKGFI